MEAPPHGRLIALPPLIDTHCHLGDPAFDEDRDEVVARAREAGLAHAVIVGDDIESSDAALELARRYGLSATAGVHPHKASGWSTEVESRLRDLCERNETVAVGEAGLDYHYDYSPRDRQRHAFERQLELAAELELPIVIHAREADADMAAMLRDSSATLVLHSFSSGEDVLRAGLERDAYVSFSGMVTFRSWQQDDAVRTTPDDRLLVETDSPYLAPVPHRGKRNEPSFVIEVARRIAELLDEPFERVAQRTTSNAHRCFAIDTINHRED